jgi:hypothetical protein
VSCEPTDKHRAQFLYGVHVLSKQHQETILNPPDADHRLPNVSVLLKK